MVMGISAIAALAAPPDPVRSVDPASQALDFPDPVPPPTDEQRQPVLDFSDLTGLWPEDIVEVAPGDTDPATPDQALEGTSPLLTQGASDVDVYSGTTTPAEHIAMIHTDEVNRVNDAGKWRDIKLDLDPEGKGWSWTDPAGIRTSFPVALSNETPVTVETPEGSFSIAPSDGQSAAKATDDVVSYANAFGNADISYGATLGGVQERIVLHQAPSDPAFTFSASTKGLTLVPNLYGGIDVMSADQIVATLPAPVAYDSSEEMTSSTGAFELIEDGDDTWQLTMRFDPTYLASAAYPVVIDPTWDDSPNRDGYTNGASPSTSYESNDFLQVDSNKRSYLKFDTSSISQAEILIYNASLFVYPESAGSVTGGIDAKRVVDPLPNPGTLNWNNQPAVGTSDDNVSAAGSDGWFDWDVTDLYQHYVDPSNVYNAHYDNNGVALTANNPKTFHAVDSSLQNSDPKLYITYNNLPAHPSFKSPPNGYISESESLTLKINGGQAGYPNDPDNDDVLVGFEISDDGTNWTGTHLIFASPFDDKPSFTVPSGVLTDGQTYWWRAVSRDVCDNQTQALCSLTDGLGTKHEPNASVPKSFTVALKHFGSDPKWYMWSHDVGNNMNLQVNGSNGNLYLDVPLATFATPLGDLGIDLAYNSQRGANYGLTPGWELAIGPRAAKRGLPVELVRMDTGNDADLKVRFRGGRTRYFTNQDDNLWGATSAGSGRVWQDDDDQYHYLDGEGGIYVFASNALNGSQLLSAKPASTADTAPNKEYTYSYDASLHLTKVADPLGREVNVTWANGLVESISTVDYRPGTDTGAITFDLQYTGTTILDKIVIPENGPPTPTTATIDLNYGSTGISTGLLTEVKDGVTSSGTLDGWDVTYAQSGASGNQQTRVSTITAPDGGSPTTPPTPWTFRYHGPWYGTSVGGVCITDPRQTPTSNCDAETTTDDPYETQIEFSTAAYPIERYAPIDPGQTFRPVATYAFDNHNNLLCERTPEANALGGFSCTSQQGAQGVYNDLDDGGLSTVYDYQTKAPYNVKEITRPAPDVSAFPRLRESYAYDGGASFNGLTVEMYPNAKLSGLPSDERIWNDLDQDWDGQAAPGVTGDNDTWSLRLGGLLDTSAMAGDKVKFRVFSDDGVRLSVEGATILDCFADDHPNEAEANCGEGDVSKVVWGNTAAITIEYADHTGDAALDVRWDQGNGTWQTIPAWTLSPDLGILTSTTYTKLTSGNAFDLSQERWTYPTDDLKFRHLYEDHVREDLATPTSYTERFTYGNTFGRVKTHTTAYGTPKAATTTYTYTDGAAPAGWPANIVGKQVSCMTKAVDQFGFTMDYQCDRAGNTIQSLQNVRVVSGTDQGIQTRTTKTTFDLMNRPTIVEQVETGQKTTTVYDRAGRVSSKTVAVTGSANAQTTYVYDHAGHLKTETLPDPDAAGSGQPSPVIQHQWNWADLETKLIDPRAKQWTSTYDAIGRVKTQTSPLGAVTTSTYQLDTSLNQTVVTSPAGVDMVTAFDVLGNKLSEKLESYNPTLYSYDVLGNQTKVTNPAGVETKSTYSNLSELNSTEEFFGTAQSALTTNTYDGAGFLKDVDGPLLNDTITYTHDALGRLTAATYQGVTLPSSATLASVNYVYNDVGERIQVSQPLTTSTTMNRYWSYDQAGRQKTYRDSGGTTTTTYNLAGWVTQVSDPRASLNTIFYGYDNLGRRVCRHTATCTGSTSAAETWTYDAAGNVTQAKTPAVAYNLAYDNDGRLSTESRGATVETTYTYNATNAQLTSIADGAGTTAFTYNFAGQISTIDDPFVGSTPSPLTTYSYEPTTGRMLTRTDAQANLVWTRAYEPDTGRLDTQTIKNAAAVTLASFNLDYNKASDVTQKASTVFSNASNATWTYAYDPAHRLTNATGKNAAGQATTWDYAYDGGGNRISAKETTGSVITNVTTAYNAQGLPTAASDSVTGESITYTHDQIGNLTKADSSVAANDWAFTYDSFSRVTCAKQATTCGTSPSVQFTYDAFDRAVTRAYNGSTTTYTYQGTSEAIAKAVTGSTTTSYAYTAGGEPMAEKTGAAAPTFHLRDPHGDVVGMVSTTAANQGTVAFNAYGKALAATGTQSILGYQGDMTDAITKQVDMGTRWYAPGQGRFTSRDVLFGNQTDPMTLNQYAYGGMNPVTMIDPTGMGQCSMVRDCQTSDGHGGVRAVGGNPGTADSPYYGCACVYTPPPPQPAPIIEYVPRPFTNPAERTQDVERYDKWVEKNPSLRVDRDSGSSDPHEADLTRAQTAWPNQRFCGNGGCIHYQTDPVLGKVYWGIECTACGWVRVWNYQVYVNGRPTGGALAKITDTPHGALPAFIAPAGSVVTIVGSVKTNCFWIVLCTGNTVPNAYVVPYSDSPPYGPQI